MHIEELIKLEAIRESRNPHRSTTFSVCKFNITNPDHIIKISPIEATPKDIEEFKMHIEGLIRLGAIRESRSPNRSTAFIVRNHNEIVREKSRMVINKKT
jgi:hypothetical protein